MSALYAAARWRARRARQLRDEPLCQWCLREGRTTPATIADHIEPHRRDREKFFNGALQSLCNRSVEDRNAPNGLAMLRGEREGGRAAPMVADDEHRSARANRLRRA